MWCGRAAAELQDDCEWNLDNQFRRWRGWGSGVVGVVAQLGDSLDIPAEAAAAETNAHKE